jgi:hypothetical protein
VLMGLKQLGHMEELRSLKALLTGTSAIDFYSVLCNPLVMSNDLVMQAYELGKGPATAMGMAHIAEFMSGEIEGGDGYLLGNARGRQTFNRAIDQYVNWIITSGGAKATAIRIGEAYTKIDSSNAIDGAANIYPAGLLAAFRSHPGLHQMLDEAVYKVQLHLMEMVQRQNLLGFTTPERRQLRQQAYSELFTMMSGCYGTELAQGRAPSLGARTCFDKPNPFDAREIPGVVVGFLTVSAFRCKCQMAVEGAGKRGGRRVKSEDDDDSDAEEDENDTRDTGREMARAMSNSEKDAYGDSGMDNELQDLESKAAVADRGWLDKAAAIIEKHRKHA